MNLTSLKRVIGIIPLSFCLASCGTLGTSDTTEREYRNMPISRVLDVAEKLLITNGYQIKDKNYKQGKLLSISKAQVGRRIMFIPTRYDRTYFEIAAKSDSGPTEVLFNYHVDESGVLASSEWAPRNLTEQDQYEFLRLIQEIDLSVGGEATRPSTENEIYLHIVKHRRQREMQTKWQEMQTKWQNMSTKTPALP